jgi:uncharacterized protein YoxC
MMVSIMGYFSLLIIIGTPFAVIVLFIWIYQLKKNSDLQVEQNKKIIQLLEKE